MSKNRILLVGCGAMGGSLIQGWIKSAINTYDFEIVNPTPRTDFHLLQHQSPSTYKGHPNIIIFAVKPQILDRIIEDYKDIISPDTIIISVAAGKNISFFQNHFKNNIILRGMPNIPTAVNKGVILLSETKDSDTAKTVEHLFSFVGQCFWIKETLFDSMTALTGSGPAYIYLLTEVLSKIIKATGVKTDDSIEMAKQLVSGSAELMMHSNKSPEELRKAVTSPKGVTEAALNTLMPDVQTLFNQAIQKATQRSKDLSK